MTEMPKAQRNEVGGDVWVPTACGCCVDGPCSVKVHRVNGIAIDIKGDDELPGFDLLTKNRGGVCPKAYGLLQKLYNPYRIKGPLKRTNPEKGMGVDPKWVEISWDEALQIVAERLKEIRAKDSRRLAHGYGLTGGFKLGSTWHQFIEAFGPTQKLESGHSVHCDMAEHSFANYIHGAMQCEPDLDYCKYLLLFGSNTSASGGVTESILFAGARERGLKTVLIDPVLSVTGAKVDEWLPIKPGTDAAFWLAMIQVIVNELGRWDGEFLKNMTNSPYLVGPDGYFMRDKATNKVLIWDAVEDRVKAYDDDTIKDFALEGSYTVDGVECKPSFQMLKDHVRQYTPEWASQITDIPADTIRRIAKEFIDSAMIGSTIMINGMELPYRPAATKLGRGVTGVMRSYQCILADHILACLVGSLEVPGGHQGGMAHPWMTSIGVDPGPDGMPQQRIFPFTWPPVSYGGTETLVPYAKAYGSLSHLSWRNLVDPPKNFPLPPLPEALIIAICNPLTSIGEPEIVAEALKRIPFFVCFAYVENEMTEFADIVLPEHIELERFEVATWLRSALAKRYSGIVLRQPVVKPVCNTIDFSDILTELADRIGMLDEYNAFINGGVTQPEGQAILRPVVGLTDPYKLELGKKYTWEEILDRKCKSLTNGAYDLEWLKKHGAIYWPVTVEEQYEVHLRMKAEKQRYSVPYWEHVKRTGEELAHNLAEVGIDWWPTSEYVPLPVYIPSIIEEQSPEYDLYLVHCRAMQFSFARNVDMPWLIEISRHVRGLEYILMNSATAKARSINDGDEIWVESEVGKVKSKVKLCQGIRPDTLAVTGQFGQWATPIAKDTGRVSQTHLTPIRASWTDHMTSGMQAHCVKVKVYKA